MRLSLLFLSLLISFLGAAAQEVDVRVDTLSPRRCVFDIQMEKGHLSGILISQNQEDAIIGTMVNEFGITALSFIYAKSSEKIKFENVIGFLNKWYIKRVLKGDIKYCLHVLYGMPTKENKNYQVSQESAMVTITNKKRKISYSFSPLVEESEDDEE
ncbi:hypothetical protein [Bacteroides caecimuris]|uniref:hypothetical protein n=1 Tax=Bacteroides caecimuris TaxID=1796613 RepID=UPI00265B2DE2|nr:hypothetical protein [Bacteroides caecimuris]